MRRSKYGALRTKVGDITFASKKEAARYSQLKLLERAKKIRNLKLQPRYKLIVNGSLICTYVGDFEYEEVTLTSYVKICEDAKGMRLREYINKAKLFKALYPNIDHREV